MKALSVKQPFASLIASGRKTIETRNWSTSYRGDLLIVSSKTSCRDDPEKYPDELLGWALCVINLVDCRMMQRLDEEAAACYVYAGAVAWVFENIRRIKPFPVRGKQGLFDVDEFVR